MSSNEREREAPRQREAYRLVCHRRHGSEGSPLYSVRFNDRDPRYHSVVAVVGKRCATVYECAPGGSSSSPMSVLQSYVDANEGEELWACEWLRDTATAAPLLAVAGLHAVIKIICCATRTLACTLSGHGGGINELRVHPTHPELLLSASRDESVRLWNVDTRVCVAQFAGDGGHQAQVLSVDCHPSGRWMASGGMDRAVRVWDLLDDPRIARAIARAAEPDARPEAFVTCTIHSPAYVSRHLLHGNYVDCVAYVGDLVLSKAVGGPLKLWRTPASPEKPPWVVRAYPTCADLWYVRFGLDMARRRMALGNETGCLRVFDLDEPSATAAQLTHVECKTCIRHCAFSPDGRTIVAVCDDGTVWQWQQQKSNVV